MKQTKVYVVGGGIFGCMAARALADAGMEVTVFDSKKKFRGSRPAGCVMKPSWMTSLDYKGPMKFLESKYEVHSMDFKVVGPIKATCFRVDPAAILLDTAFKTSSEFVTEVKDGVVVTDNKTYRGLVVVAAGVWSRTLLPQIPEIRSLAGSAVIGKGHVEQPTIHIYAPYRQAVWFSRERDETWFGDGTAILEKNFKPEHVDKTAERARDLASISGKTYTGYRPYIKGANNGLFEKLGNNLYVMTGGAKNGTILAAHQTLQLLGSI